MTPLLSSFVVVALVEMGDETRLIAPTLGLLRPGVRRPLHPGSSWRLC